ncbi:WYL domain-containing protein [uncultured Capnocytophaga sp.]|uniref:helix-turn-helix transcriptional regulator n=1 Tax=uncultured Capnocytophaga sp. TaxID=159273 RepID=UPI00260CB2E5|nr:WYL domain-containing protein [uncultured Capnocytophaga sp.]
MSLANVFLRHRFILERLRVKPHTFEQLEHYWEISEMNIEGQELSQRTLQRDIPIIAAVYRVFIKCNRSNQEYYIIDEAEAFSQNLLEAFDVYHALQNYYGKLSESILFDKRIPQGTQYLSPLLDAIEKQKQIEIHYHKFWGSKEVQIRTIEPYLLKESQRRWYVLALDVDKKLLRVFGLDRIKSIEDIGIKRMYDPPKEIERFFDDIFGVWVDNDRTKAEKVILSFKKQEGDSFFIPNPAEYLRAMPLHRSQVFIKDTPEEMILSLKVKITPDFVKEILSYGAYVRVIEPQHLADRIKTEIKNALQLYDI